MVTDVTITIPLAEAKALYRAELTNERSPDSARAAITLRLAIERAEAS